MVDNEDVAKECIKRAKKLNLGRFSFIPLNRLKAEEKPLRYPRVRGAVDFAINLVDYDPKYERVVRFVFGDTLIVEDFDSAKLIGIGTYRMVTLEGELFEKTGIISGGNVKSSGELGSKYYEDLLNELEREEKELKEQEENLLRKIKELRALAAEKLATLKVLDKKLGDFSEKNFKELESRILERIRKAEEYVEYLKAKKEELEKELKEINNEINHIECILDELKQKENNISQYYLSEDLNTKREEYRRLKEKVNKAYEELKNLESLLEKKRYEKEILKNEIYNKERELAFLSEKEDNLIKEIKEGSEKIENLRREIGKTEEKVESLLKEKESLEKELNDLKEEVGTLNKEEERIKKEMNSVEMRLISINDKLESIEEKLKVYKDVEVEVEATTPEELKEELKILQEELRKLGSVNFAAEEDYERELERYKDFKQKYEKLKEESKAIKNMINEIEGKKKKVFMEAFNSINKNLKNTFGFLSPGGKAQLIIENREDPFSGGVHLIVKPRGKDVQYLEAMSGGEKTLAALSLIFAIQEYKPSPFYYFDEVDAHLDEINAKKVGELIREKSKKAQFIVVTLREVVASFADKLIAVTARKGVSEVFILENEALKEILKEA